MVTRKRTAPKQFTSWSFSRYRDYTACPLAAKLKHLDKLGEKENDAMRRGSAIHKLAEDFIKKPRAKLPAELSLFKEEFAAAKKNKTAIAEDSWTFDRQWGECAWDDWNVAWLRVKVDLHWLQPFDQTVLKAIDVKTGRPRKEKAAEYAEQLHLTSVAGLLRYPTAQAVESELWYVDEGVIVPDPETEGSTVLTRAELPKAIKLWERKVKPMFVDTSFKPKPNDGCRYCPHSRAKGGVCQY